MILPDNILINPWKHHLKWMKNEIEKFQFSQDNINITSVINQIKALANNITDVYVGNLSTDQIKAEIVDHFNNSGIVTPSEFIQWLGEKGFLKISISDGPSWIIRLSPEKVQFVHIHPAKKSIHCKRIKGSALKTVLTCQFLGNSVFLTGSINRIRKLYLDLSPVKDDESHRQLEQAFHLFQEDMIVNQ